MTARKVFARRMALLVSAVLLAGTAMAQDIPDKLKPPPGATLIGAYQAKGVQIYICAAHGAATEWTLKAPEAQLVDAKGAIFAKHYAGPTWEAVDGSKAVGKVMEMVPSPTAGAIPWLLLSTEPSGQGVLANARFAQRVKTAGGAVQSAACSQTGAEQRVPYTAEYVFYK
jgi:Protein of unknown function (DUF3455)